MGPKDAYKPNSAGFCTPWLGTLAKATSEPPHLRRPALGIGLNALTLRRHYARGCELVLGQSALADMRSSASTQLLQPLHRRREMCAGRPFVADPQFERDVRTPLSRKAGGGQALHQDTWNITSAARFLSRWHGRRSFRKLVGDFLMRCPRLESKPLLLTSRTASHRRNASHRIDYPMLRQTMPDSPALEGSCQRCRGSCNLRKSMRARVDENTLSWVMTPGGQSDGVLAFLSCSIQNSEQ